MEGNQKIHCKVHSCRYNDDVKNKCTLTAIEVAPIENCNTKTPDESMCSSYEYERN